MERQELAGFLKALSDATRLSIFEMLMDGVQCNCEIADRLGLSLSLISHHVRVLLAAGLVQSERDPHDARWIYYSVDQEALVRLSGALGGLLDPSRIKPREPNCGPKPCRKC